jgi:hypothetical protein
MRFFVWFSLFVVKTLYSEYYVLLFLIDLKKWWYSSKTARIVVVDAILCASAGVITPVTTVGHAFPTVFSVLARAPELPFHPRCWWGTYERPKIRSSKKERHNDIEQQTHQPKKNSTNL